MPECFAHACRQAPVGPGYGISGIQRDDRQLFLAELLDSRYQRAGMTRNKASRNTF
jgi:hypothetical protein